MKKRFDNLMAIADRAAAGSNRLRDTILKEVLHHDILYALHKSDLAERLVFQGGTALRLCYGNNRYSEDLDFVRRAPLDGESFEQFKTTLMKVVHERYGLEVRVADPKKPLDARTDRSSVAVHRWTAIIDVQRPGARNQRINIEVADIPAYDARPRQVTSPYAEAGAGPILLNTSSEREILADKVVAIVGRPYLKARDIWDIKWLLDRGNTLNAEWVRLKAGDYNLAVDGDMTSFLDTLDERIAALALPETNKKYHEEMSRFLAKEQADFWLKGDTNSQLMLMEVGEFLERSRNLIAAPPAEASTGTVSQEERLAAWRKKHQPKQ